MINNDINIMNVANRNVEQLGKISSYNTQDDTRLREQTDKFEAMFVKILLDNSLKLENSLYEKQPGTDIYNAMYKESLSDSLSGKFGYSDLLFRFLKDKQQK